MGLLLFNSNGKYVFSSDNAGSFIIAPDTIKIVPGGTATDATITRPYNGIQIAEMKSELSSTYTADELNSAVAVSINGTKTGTVILDVSACGAVGDFILIVHRKSDNTWEQLYYGAIPSNNQVTVTLSSFSPIVTMKTATPIYNINATLTNVTADEKNPTTIKGNETKTLGYYAMEGYELPASVTVPGATSAWSIEDAYSISIAGTQGITINGENAYTGELLSSETITLQLSTNSPSKALPIRDPCISCATYTRSSDVAGTLVISHPNIDITSTINGINRYSISGTTNNATINGTDSYTGWICYGNPMSFNVGADGVNYKLPASISVTGATGTYTRTSNTTGTLKITAPNNSVQFTVTGTPIVTYNVTATALNATINGNSSYIGVLKDTDTLTLTLGANGTTHKLPESITVTGATGTYTRTSNTAGTIVISNPTADVSFALEGVEIPISKIWYFNSVQTEWRKYNSFYTTFTSNDKSFDCISAYQANGLMYGQGMYAYLVCENQTWPNEAYRTVAFDETPSGDLLSYLQTYATPIET